MILFPAIDIQDSKVVRLSQGKFDQVTQYSDDPIKVAQEWVAQGADWLHVVDLDGAKTGEVKNTDIIISIAKSVKASLQVGGGIRETAHIEKLLNAGIKRVILGTKIIEDRKFLQDVLKRWPKNIAVSLDCSNGFVAQRGWQSTTNIKATNLAKDLERLDLSCIIYTDIARDGMLTGPNFEGLKEMLSATKIPVIASGGVSSIEDIKKLNKLNVLGAITGKAIYEGKINLREAIQICSQNV